MFSSPSGWKPSLKIPLILVLEDGSKIVIDSSLREVNARLTIS